MGKGGDFCPAEGKRRKGIFQYCGKRGRGTAFGAGIGAGVGRGGGTVRIFREREGVFSVFIYNIPVFEAINRRKSIFRDGLPGRKGTPRK